MMPFGFDWCRKSTTTPRTAAVDDDEGWLDARSVDVLKRSPGGCVACVRHKERFAAREGRAGCHAVLRLEAARLR